MYTRSFSQQSETDDPTVKHHRPNTQTSAGGKPQYSANLPPDYHGDALREEPCIMQQEEPEREADEKCRMCLEHETAVKEENEKRKPSGGKGFLNGMLSGIFRDGVNMDDLLLIGLVLYLFVGGKSCETEQEDNDILLLLLVLFVIGF